MPIPKFIEVVTGDIGDKRRWRQYKARTKALPANYRTAVEAIERYPMHLGPGDGPDWASMWEDLIDLFEQSAANETPVREVVGGDPVEFVETFARNYGVGRWIARERERLSKGIDRAAEGKEGGLR